MIDYYSIGRRIQQRRVQRNITQERLAEMVNVSVPHISRIENGSSHHKGNRCNQLCRCQQGIDEIPGFQVQHLEIVFPERDVHPAIHNRR